MNEVITKFLDKSMVISMLYEKEAALHVNYYKHMKQFEQEVRCREAIAIQKARDLIIL